ncbi:MAG: domain containing protein [Actinomycetia bacterium]|nr:domain containing protein [Actinomycetes bacterium]
MSQPPENATPEDRPWQNPGSSQPNPQDPYGSAPPPQDPHGRPPAYGGTYGQPTPQPYGRGGQQPPPYDPAGQCALPQYAGGTYGYQDPAAGLASRWARLGAAIIDGLILSAVDFVISLPFVNWGRIFVTQAGESISLSEFYKYNLVTLIIGFCYFWLLTYKWSGQTVGKKALGIRVVRAEDRGPISNSQALMRALIYAVVGNVCSCFGLINVLWILWDPRRQCLHDKAAKTVVMKVNPGDPDPYATTKY